MADISKAEKIAAARRRLKEHQQKSREPDKSAENRGICDSNQSNVLQKLDYGAGINQLPSNISPELKWDNQSQDVVSNSLNSNIAETVPQVQLHTNRNIFQNGSQIADDSSAFKKLSVGTDVITSNRVSPLLEAKSFFDSLPSNNNWQDRQTTHSLFTDHAFPQEYNQRKISEDLAKPENETVYKSQSSSPINYIETTDLAESIYPQSATFETFYNNFESEPINRTNSATNVFAGSVTLERNAMLSTDLLNQNSVELTTQSNIGQLCIQTNSSTAAQILQEVNKLITAEAYDNGTEERSLISNKSFPIIHNLVESTLTNPLAELEVMNAELIKSDAHISPRSTSENIRQLSMQVHGLINESYPTAPTENANELECRNQELAGLLEEERQRSEQMLLQLQECQSRLSQHSSEVAATRTEAEAQYKRELVPLQEQLQIHIQTVGILVAEKTELQATLSQCQSAAKLRASEVEELQSRLKASRHRVSDLEKEVATLNATNEQGDTLKRTSTAELDRLQTELRQMAERRQEVEEERDEINHRLSTKTAECSLLSQDLYETRTQLSLAQLRVEQLGSPENADVSLQLEDLHQTKLNLEQQVITLEAEVQALTSEREDSSRHYQQYVATLDARVLSLAEQQRGVSDENRRLSERETSLVHHVEQLEKRLQETSGTSPIEQSLKQALADLEARLAVAEEENHNMANKLQLKSKDTEQWEAEVGDRDARIEELEVMLQHMESDQPDQARLLAAMESDKVGASRAVAQNQQLKQELEELQAAFVSLSNCKMDLTDKLQHERHVTRELQLRGTEYEASIAELRMRLTEEQPAHDHQAAEDLTPINDILHRELTQTKERIEALAVQNSELRTLLAHQPSAVNSLKDEQVSALTASVRRLTEERDQLAQQCSSDEARPALEEKFRATMLAVAELTDEKQRLEHLVLQLQGETETIGEYITLYQKQRKLLCQRADEKDHQLRSLTQDREEMRAKLSQLNKLIQRLVAEKGTDATDAVLKDFTNNELTNGELAELRHEAEVLTNEPAAPDADTADKIMALLTEIGSSNLVDPQQLVEHFHPCPWCSGRLITV